MYTPFLGFIALGLSLIPASEGTCTLCGSGFSDLDTEVSDAKDKAIEWLAGQQQKDGSWPSVNTQNAIFGLQMADPSWLQDQDLVDRRLTKARLEYELLQFLMPSACSNCEDSDSSNDSDEEGGVCCAREFERGAGILGQYMLALHSVCCNETGDFYTVDLDCLMVKLLKDFPENNFNNFFQFSLAILSLCSQGSDTAIFKKALQKLADGPGNGDPCGGNSHTVDILSMEVMAMVCARPQAMGHNLDDWEDIIDARVQCIRDSQDDTDCSFGGNAITTALALQALNAAGATPLNCLCNDTVLWLLDQQKDDGGFGDVGATSQIIPILNCNNFGSLPNVSINCPNFETDLTPSEPGDETVETDLTPIEPGDETTTFKVSVDDGSTVTDYTTVTILTGESLYLGLVRLEELNVGFTFVTQDSSFGKYLVTVNGDSSTASTYWSIVIVEDGVEESAAAGIEGLFPEEDDCFILRLVTF